MDNMVLIEEDSCYFGRSSNGNPPYQLLSDHLHEVAASMKLFCKPFMPETLGEVCGLLHDIGKYSRMFQQRVRGAPIATPHSIVGAKVATEYADSLMQQEQKTPPLFSSAVGYYLMAYCIAGHHTGLPDFGNANADESTLYKRLATSDLPDCSAWKTEIAPTFPQIDPVTHFSQAHLGFSYFLATHFLFSSLVDADRISAANFPTPKQRPAPMSLQKMQSLLESHMARFSGISSDIGAIRNDIRKACLNAAKREPGMFTLTVPTGGGKTLASLSFALSHAVKYNHQRIIYTIPFTSIIEQNAAVYKSIFGEENVLEHHANFRIAETDENAGRVQLAAENWNFPLIMTTNVQFFESLFSASPSKSRKVHNIANSVIILDEVQALPTELLLPCLSALAELVRSYHCTVILCTATQPRFKENGLLPYVDVTPIIQNYPELAARMKRVEAQYIEKQSNEEIVRRLRNEEQVLCIVNTKRHAQELFEEGNNQDGWFHLSTNMYPTHRKQTIAEIRAALREGRPCRVISTQLIEAGVDLDFPVVYRSLAGIDSIVQAAGRCNREGKRNLGHIYIFNPEKLYVSEGYLKQTADITASFRKDLDFISDEAVDKYFSELYKIRNDPHNNLLDKTQILEKCKNAIKPYPPAFPFRSISDEFRLIADEGTAVVIPTPEASALLAEANDMNLAIIQRKIAPYCVNVRGRELKILEEQNLIRKDYDLFMVLTDMSIYDSKLGLMLT